MRPQTNHRKKAFTVVELLVSCMCCSILAAIAIPVIQVSRDESEVLECANQLRQIAIAAHNYHDAHKRLPPSTLGVKGVVAFEDWQTKGDMAEHYWQTQQNTNSLMMLTFFMELNRIGERVDPFSFDYNKDLTHYLDARGDAVYGWQGDIVGVKDVALIDIPQFCCPTDNLNEDNIQDVIIATQPCLNAKAPANDLGLMTWPDKGGEKFMRTNYLGNGGVTAGQGLNDPKYGMFNGPMQCRVKNRLETIRDGTSNTILYGESLGEINDGKRTKAMSWAWGGHARGRGAVEWNKSVDAQNPKRRILGDKEFSSIYGFGSKHDVGVNFAMADGSVKNLSRDTDQQALYSMFGMKDGRAPGKVDDNLQAMKQREKMKLLQPQNDTERAIFADENLTDRDKAQFIEAYRRATRRNKRESRRDR